MVNRRFSRRRFNRTVLQLAAAALVSLHLPGFAVFAQTGTRTGTQPGAPSPSGTRLRIGIIGSGRIGGAIGRRWAEAGHQVMFSSRNPDGLAELVATAGGNASSGYPQDAASFGDVILLAVPYGAMPQVGADYARLMAGKVIIDCTNPRADRDGPMADEAISQGTGMASAAYFPGTRLVRAFNAVSFTMVEDEAHRDGELIGIPVAGDDAEAVAVAEQLVRDAGFDPVRVGDLDSARRFDRGTPVYVRGMTAAQLREALDLPE